MSSLPQKKTAATGQINFQGVTISHPDRVIDPQTGLTKGRLAEYYSLVSPYLLQNVEAHPLTLIRCPEGIEGETFYQRNPGHGLGPHVIPFKWRHKGRTYEYFYTESTAGLLEMVQMGSVEFHPWETERAESSEPVFDRRYYPAPEEKAARSGAL